MILKKRIGLWGMLLCCTMGFSAQAQIKVTWSVLADVEFSVQYFEEYGAEYLVPVFGPGPKAFDGKEVLVSGYFIPVSVDDMFFVLSKNPYSSCYFCGNAGPETIVELELADQDLTRLRTDQHVTLKGVLVLNDSNVEHCNYILKDAELFQ